MSIFIICQFRDQSYDDTPPKQGALIHAFDQTTGEHVWQFELDTYPLGTLMTYLHNGRQFLVVSTGSISGKGELVALALGD